MGGTNTTVPDSGLGRPHPPGAGAAPSPACSSHIREVQSGRQEVLEGPRDTSLSLPGWPTLGSSTLAPQRKLCPSSHFTCHCHCHCPSAPATPPRGCGGWALGPSSGPCCHLPSGLFTPHPSSTKAPYHEGPSSSLTLPGGPHPAESEGAGRVLRASPPPRHSGVLLCM